MHEGAESGGLSGAEATSRDPVLEEAGRTIATTARTERDRVRRGYERLAPVYDLCTAPMERLGLASRRRRLVRRARGHVLEVGVGTGHNLEHYPGGTSLTAAHLSASMLGRTRRRARRLDRRVRLALADVERLPFRDDAFHTVVATCLFCSVPDPVRGLAELRRVTREPDGRVLLLEHVRPDGAVLGFLADLLSPLTRRLFGFNLNRRTERDVIASGLTLVEVLREGIWREMATRAASGATPTPIVGEDA